MNVKFKINYFTNLGKYSCLIITYLLCDFDAILKIYCNSIKRFHILNVVGFAQEIGLQKLWGYRIQVRIRKMPRIVAANISDQKIRDMQKWHMESSFAVYARCPVVFSDAPAISVYNAVVEKELIS